MAQTVDTEGRSIVLTTTKEHAELKRDQIHAYGKDDLDAEGCKGSMYATVNGELAVNVSQLTRGHRIPCNTISEILRLP